MLDCERVPHLLAEVMALDTSSRVDFCNQLLVAIDAKLLTLPDLWEGHSEAYLNGFNHGKKALEHKFMTALEKAKKETE